MKRVCVIVFLLLTSVMRVLAEDVSREQAEMRAASFFSSVGCQSERAPELVVAVQGFYIFNHPTSKAFVVVAAESRMRTVLAYGLNRHFSKPQSVDDLNGLLLLYAHQYRKLRENPTARVNKLSSYGRARLLRTAEWNQSYGFWWNACPMIGDRHTHAGCTPTAMAIMMRYHQWPRYGYGSHSYVSEKNGFRLSADFSRKRYDWASLPMGDGDDSLWTDVKRNTVAQILLDCGIAAEANYGLGSTPAGTPHRWLYYHFGYALARRIERAKRNDEEWMRLICNEITNNRPLFYSYEFSHKSHQFICDGFDDNGLLHFNFGWGGSNNGFYSIDRVVGDRVSSGEEIAIGVSPNRNRDNEVLPQMMLMDDDNGIVYAPEIPDRVTRVACFDITVKNLRVMSREPFSGVIAAWLCDQRGTRKCKLGEKSIYDVSSGSTWGDYSVACSIPQNVQVNQGDQIRLFTSTSQGREWVQVTSLAPEYDHASLNGHFVNETRLMYFSTDDSSKKTGMQLQNNYLYYDHATLLTLYMIKNVSGRHLYGTLSLWLCDSNGNGKALLGSGNCNLQPGYFYTEYPIYVQMPAGVPINHGDAIHLFFQEPNSSDWHHIKYDSGYDCKLGF